MNLNLQENTMNDKAISELEYLSQDEKTLSNL